MIKHTANEWKDVTYTIFDDMVFWPGQIPPKTWKLAEISKGHGANVTAIQLSGHTGTHLDAPLHFIEEGRDITAFPVSLQQGRARIVEVNDPEKISAEEIYAFEKRRSPVEEGEVLFFKTRESEKDWTGQAFNPYYVYFTTGAIEYLLSKKITMLGTDYLSIGNEENNSDIHKALLSREVWILEGLDLRNISEGEYDYFCKPLKIKGADGAPAMVLMRSFGREENLSRTKL